jgi:integrase
MERYPNPARSPLLTFPHAPPEEVNPPGFAEYLAIYEAISRRYQLALDVLEAGGLRIEEAASLLVKDLDRRNGRIRVSRERTKGRRPISRWVPLPEGLMTRLTDHATATKRGPEDRILGITDQGLRNAMARACIAAEVSHYKPHDLRHRFASVRVMAGWPTSVVSKTLGHRKESITSDIYSHVLTEEPDWLLDQLKEQQSRGGSVVASRYPAAPQNDERPAQADLSPRMGVTGLEPVTPSLSSWCSPN